MAKILIIGGGPAGLRAAEIASAGGAETILCEQKRSVGRKFLVAGKGGLNLTHTGEIETFANHYEGPEQPHGFWKQTLEKFNNDDLRTWADGLGVPTFTQRSGRVYPVALKAAPLLRRWISRLRSQGVEFRTGHRLTKLENTGAAFETPEGLVRIEADAIILALGGGSWPSTGSDGQWSSTLSDAGISISPLAPANCGWEVVWPEDLREKIEGQPLKNIVAMVGGKSAPGELMITRYGLEGGPIYRLGPELRSLLEPELTLDLKPSLTRERMVAKMESVRRNFLAESRTRWKLPHCATLLLDHFAGPFESAGDLATAAKELRIPLTGPRPLEEAISSAGGVMWAGLKPSLELRHKPGVFVAGEMIDWEAPTGGFLLQGCFATGTLAAESALEFISADSSR